MGIIDTSSNDCTSKFLQYSGNALLNFWSAEEMHPEHIRLALLSMLRAGGVLAMNLDLFGSCVGLDDLAEPFEMLSPGLFRLLLSRQLLVPDPTERHGLPLFHGLVDKERDGT